MQCETPVENQVHSALVAGTAVDAFCQQAMKKEEKCKASRKQHAVRKPKAEPQAQPAVEPTEYAKNRPRREVQGPRTALGQTSESLELMACENFVGPPGSGAPQAQPFRVSIHPQVIASPPCLE